MNVREAMRIEHQTDRVEDYVQSHGIPYNVIGLTKTDEDGTRFFSAIQIGNINEETATKLRKKYPKALFKVFGNKKIFEMRFST